MQQIPIKGLQKTTLIDFPGKIACILFLGGCNFRCGYCYNADLVLNLQKLPTIPENEFFSFLERRKNYLEGVCISGGEPTLHKDLPRFCAQIKELGFLVKLDTNGTNPLMVDQLITSKLIDYIAMDIKASKENYSKVAGAKIQIPNIEKTVSLIKDSGIDYEFRTTVIPGLYNEIEAENIGKWLTGAKQYFLQQFRATTTTIDPEFSNLDSYSPEELKRFKKILERYIPKVAIRGC